MENIFIKLDVAAIRSGIGAQLGARNFLVLTSIASHMDGNGKAFPSQDKIAAMTGYSRQTISRTIKELKEMEINGEPVLSVTQRKTPSGLANTYNLSKNVGFSFGNRVSISTEPCNKTDKGMSQNEHDHVKLRLQEEELITRTNNKNHITREKELEEKDIIFETTKDVVQYFQQKYFEKYDVVYNPNWGRDSKLIKSKLMSNYSSTEIKTMIDITFRDYDKRWKVKQYPRPSLGQISTWLGNKALTIAAEESKKNEKIVVDSKKYELDADDWERRMNMI